MGAAFAAPAIAMPAHAKRLSNSFAMISSVGVNDVLLEPSNLLYVALPIRKLADLALGLVLRNAVLLLNLAHQLIATTRDQVEVAVGQLAPLFLDLAFELFPVPFDAIPIHIHSLQQIDGASPSQRSCQGKLHYFSMCCGIAERPRCNGAARRREVCTT